MSHVFVKTNDAGPARDLQSQRHNTSENQLKRELYLASWAGRAQDLTELRVLYAVIRRAVVGVVEEVEELRSELEIHPLENRERLRCIKVHILEGWPHQIISVRMSIAANRQVTHRQMRGIHLSV